MSMPFFLLVVVGYCLLIGGGRRLFATQRNAVAQPIRHRQALGWLYWLTTGPVCLPILVYTLPRVSLSANLLPAFAFLIVGSGVVAGVYAPAGRWRRLLLAQAVVGGLLAPIIADGFWRQGGLPKPLYQQYPFSIHRRAAEYEEANWTWEGYTDPKSYYTVSLYKAGWGFDYYVGDINLDYPLQTVGASPFSPAEGAADRAFWRNIRLLTLAPDESQGQLRVLLPAPLGGYNAVTHQVNPLTEQTLPFWVNRSPTLPQLP
jgi:hypothetical protein